MRRLRLLILMLMISVLTSAHLSYGAEFFVYNIYRELDMGNPDESPQKDYYINMGTSNGVHEGSRVDVIRKFSTYDVVTEKLYQEVSFKVATLKVIHVESSLAVARLEKQATSDKTPVSPIRGVMLGDAVRLASGR